MRPAKWFEAQARARPLEDAPTPVLRHFIPQPLPPNFCWQPSQSALPRGRSGHAIGFSNQWRNQWQTRRASPLIPGQGALVAGVRPYPARESVRGRSNLKTVHWTVFPHQGAGRFSPRPREDAPTLVLGALSLNPSPRSSTGNRRKAPSQGGGPLSRFAGKPLPGDGARPGGLRP
jgi:hypothetical protein